MERSTAALWTVVLACALKRKAKGKKTLWRKSWLPSKERKRNLVKTKPAATTSSERWPATSVLTNPAGFKFHRTPRSWSLPAVISNEKANEFNKHRVLPQPLFNTILHRVKPLIERHVTHMRDPIPAGTRLNAILLYLTTGYSYKQLKEHGGIAAGYFSVLIPETCQAIYDVLKDEYMKTPSTPDEWLVVADGFEKRWNFPNCVGALGGTHVEVFVRPPANHSEYCNYKGSSSIVLMAVCDANYEFIHVDVGIGGNLSDGGIWEKSKLNALISNGTAGLPGVLQLPISDRKLPCVFLANNAFPLKPYIMVPHSDMEQMCESHKKVFSYRMSRAHRTVENALGIMANKFKVLQKLGTLQPSKVEKVVLACTALHNVLRRDYADDYTPAGMLDAESEDGGTVAPGLWRQKDQMLPLLEIPTVTPADAQEVRDQFTQYFSREGAVPWQCGVAALDP